MMNEKSERKLHVKDLLLIGGHLGFLIQFEIAKNISSASKEKYLSNTLRSFVKNFSQEWTREESELSQLCEFHFKKLFESLVGIINEKKVFQFPLLNFEK